MKNPFSNETVKSAAIVIGSAIAFIAISKGVSALRKKFGLGGKDASKALFESGKDAAKALFEAGESNDSAAIGRRNLRNDCCEETSNRCEAACEASLN
jgi:hypothetical protein